MSALPPVPPPPRPPDAPPLAAAPGPATDWTSDVPGRSLPPSPPGAPISLYRPEGPIRLRPLWPVLPALLVSGVLLLYAVPAIKRNAENLPALIAEMIAFVICACSYIYYFVCVHRTIRVLGREPGWSVDYTPAGAVWRQFIPFYNLVFNYRWTGDVADYAKWRLGRESFAGGRAGLWAFLCLLLGFVIANVVFPLGLALVFGGLYLIDTPLRRALAVPAPDSGSPGYNGTLNLR